MPDDTLKITRQILLLAEDVLIYEREGYIEKINASLKKINILSKNLQYNLKNEKLEAKKRIETPKQKKKSYLKELKLTESEVKKYTKLIKHPEETAKKKRDAGIYKTNFYARLSNLFMENLSFKLIKNHPDSFKSLFFDIKSSNMRILSETYLSMIFLTAIIAFPLGIIISFLVTFNILLSFFIGILSSILIFGVMYAYPGLAKVEKGKKIKEELFFAIVHMSAIAGSGAHPVKIFELLVDSEEYKHIEGEFQRILNYINLFGYSLSNSLKAAASTTPSDDLKELLHGMSSTIETGGDIKDYLKEKAESALIQYKFDQKKKLEALSTYSDIYTGILIAAPLLFIVTLAILEKISPELGGVSIGLIANLSVFLALPVLNIFYILFLQSVRSEI